jgi:hypothetical protein
MALTLSGKGLIPSQVIQYPRSSSSVFAKKDLLLAVGLESCFSQSVENSFKLLPVMFETALCQTEEIIDVGSYELQSVEQFGHLYWKMSGLLHRPSHW